MSDSESVEKSSPRSSALLNRPQIGPVGPRTRQSSFRTSSAPAEQSEPHQTATISLPLPTMQPATNSKPLPTQPKPLPTPSIGPSAGAPDLEEGGHSSAVAGLPSVPPDPPPPSKYLPSVKEDTEDLTSAPAYNDTQPDSDTSSQVSSRVVTTLRPKVTSAVQAPPKLTPPPTINFDSVPVPWKGMPLEPALWTLNSTELQDIVSRAIRVSAKESFLRFVPVENLDKVLPAELTRLEGAKTSAQARYRFLIHRRTMLFHALNSSFLQKSQKGDEDDLLVSKLTAQLAETIGDCDQRLEELLRINDQIAQINKLIDVHLGSALAIALRKLNSSYSRRTRDLNKARERIFQLEAELEDAWKEAEKLAKELDDYEESIAADDSTAVIETAEIVSVPRSPSQSPPPHLFERRSSTPMPMTPTLLTVKNVSVFSPTPVIASAQPISLAASPMASFVFPLPVPKTEANDDATSIKSSKSFRSTKSSKSAKCYASSIQAAKKRSFRASQSSLRLSISSGHGMVLSSNGGFSDDVPPPMPEIPIQFMSAISSAGSKNRGTKYSFPESVAASATAGSIVLRIGQSNVDGSKHRKPASISSLPTRVQLGMLQRQASFDTLVTSWRRSDAAVQAYKGKSTDDIYVGAGHKHRNHPSTSLSRSPYSKENAPVSLNWDDDNEIQLVSRSPHRSRALAQEQSRDDELPPVPPPKDPSRTIPSIWKNVEPMRYTSNPLPSVSSSPDLPSVPESDTIGSPQKATPGTWSGKAGLLKQSKTLHKIRGLTKRYSASIPPLFNGKTSSRRPA